VTVLDGLLKPADPRRSLEDMVGIDARKFAHSDQLAALLRQVPGQMPPPLHVMAQGRGDAPMERTTTW
jgi:hypothetical protein